MRKALSLIANSCPHRQDGRHSGGKRAFPWQAIVLRPNMFLVGGWATMADRAAGTGRRTAQPPVMDRISACQLGRVKTIPEGIEPGSDVANLSLLGYDPTLYHTGRGLLRPPVWDSNWHQRCRLQYEPGDPGNELPGRTSVMSHSTATSPPRRPGPWWRLSNRAWKARK